MRMDLTQEKILKTLLEARGMVRNSELLSTFTDQLNCSDPVQKKQNRDLFKTFVNNIAFVREVEQTKYICLKKVFHHLLEASAPEDAPKEQTDTVEDGQYEKESKPSEGTSWSKTSLSSVEQSKTLNVPSQGFIQFKVPLKPEIENSREEQQPKSMRKPFSLPLRMPPVKDSPLFTSVHSSADSSRQRLPKTSRPASEQYNPLDSLEHQWLVKSASGQWSQVYGLLLKDAQLAEKKDPVSGFTVLHWAVKDGDTEMVSSIISQSRKGGHGVDVNCKSHGGYTPLHIATIHQQLDVILLLLQTFGANPNIRDNYGKKPYHYLASEVASGLREILEDPKANKPQKPFGSPATLKKKSRARGRGERDRLMSSAH